MLYYGLIALDLAREHRRDLDREAARHRLLADARETRTPGRPRRVRALVARLLRVMGNTTQSIADAARAAATRLEGRSA